MRRILVLAAMALMMATAAMAQGARGPVGKKPGWAVDVSVDDFSGKKDYRCFYYDQQKVLGAVYYPESGFMAVIDWFDGKLYFDVSFDAVMDNRGQIDDRYVAYDIHVNLPGGKSREDSGTARQGFSEVQKAGQVFFSMTNINPTMDDLKQGLSLSVRWDDPIKRKTVVRKISLQGFSKCLEECAKRSVMDMMKQNGFQPSN